ncbi:MAG: RrF2 family transcriptional regulator [Oscillospiraceae bacterium]
MISTKGRYSIRILLDLAEHRNGGYIPMKEVAARQDISLKYIEKLMPALKAAGFIESVHGIGGGYRLAREPETHPVGHSAAVRGRSGPGELPEGRGRRLCPGGRLPDAAGVGGYYR